MLHSWKNTRTICCRQEYNSKPRYWFAKTLCRLPAIQQLKCRSVLFQDFYRYWSRRSVRCSRYLGSTRKQTRLLIHRHQSAIDSVSFLFVVVNFNFFESIVPDIDAFFQFNLDIPCLDIFEINVIHTTIVLMVIAFGSEYLGVFGIV